MEPADHEQQQKQRHTTNVRPIFDGRGLKRSVTDIRSLIKRRQFGTICGVSEDDFDVEVDETGETYEGISRQIIFDELGPVLDIYVDDKVTLIFEPPSKSVVKVLWDHTDLVEDRPGRIKKIAKQGVTVIIGNETVQLDYDKIKVNGELDVEGPKFKLIRPEHSITLHYENDEVAYADIVTELGAEKPVVPSNPAPAVASDPDPQPSFQPLLPKDEILRESRQLFAIGSLKVDEPVAPASPIGLAHEPSPYACSRSPNAPPIPPDILDYPSTVGQYRIPLTLLKQEFRNNALLLFQISALERHYESYRMMRGDGNCYFRGVAVSLLEFMMRATTPVDYLLTFIENIRGGEGLYSWTPVVPKQELLKHLNELAHIKQASSVTGIVLLQQYFQNSFLDKALIALMRQICINYIYHNKESPDIAPFLAEDLTYLLRKIATMGEEAEGITLLAMARGLNVNIVHYTIYREESQVQKDIERQKTVYESVEPGRPVFHLILRPGHYDILYPYEFNQVDGYSVELTLVPSQISAEKTARGKLYPFLYVFPEEKVNEGEGKLTASLNAPRKHKQLSFKLAQAIQLAYQIADEHLQNQSKATLQQLHSSTNLPAYAKRTGHTDISQPPKFNTCELCHQREKTDGLECGHIFCNQCLMDTLSASTGGQFVLNPDEVSQSQPGLACPACGVPASEFDVMLILGELHEYYASEARHRLVCDGCKRGGQGDLLKLECHSVCRACAFAAVRSGMGCPSCNQPSPALTAKLTHPCEWCKVNKNLAQEFGVIQCASDHGLLCRKCMGIAAAYSKCLVCQLAPNPDQLPAIQAESEAPQAVCQVCEGTKELPDFLTSKCADLCWVCKACMVSHVFDSFATGQGEYSCPYCGGEFSSVQLEELDLQGAANVPNPASPISKAFQCVLCMEEFSRSDMITLDCDHYFCEPCLTDFLKFQVDNRAFTGEAINCPISDCSCAIEGSILEACMTKPIFDKFNKYVLESAQGLICCPAAGCENAFFVDLQAVRSVECNSCSHAFCTVCRNPDHPGFNCEEHKVRAAIEIARTTGEAVAQCPNCRNIYTKDDNCEHVKCVNPACTIDFCFKCACYRSPTLAHGNHYHRPQCTFWSEFDDEDEFSDACEQCIARGRLCKRPKDLKNERIFI